MTKAPIHDPLAAALARKSLAGGAGEIVDRPVAAGDGWRVNDVVCSCGPRDYEAEERSSTTGVALLLSGSFVAQDANGTSLLSEGSLFLVEAGRCFLCSHRHGEGDRCLSFQFAPAVFEYIAHDAGAKPTFAHNRLPPLRALSNLTARAHIAMREPQAMEEVAFELAGAVAVLAGRERGRSATLHHGRMAPVLRYMAEHSAAPHTVAGLARMAKLSPSLPAQLQDRDRRDAAPVAATRAAARRGGKACRHKGAGDRDRARRRLRGPLEFHPHVPRGVWRLPAGIPTRRLTGSSSAIFSKS